MRISVFTPAYNRGHLLKNLYLSLLKQTYTDFEWIIVDDGSTDNTSEVVEDFIKDKAISIRYFKQANGGKHRAINRGVQEALGELFFIVDSDDTLPENSLEIINKYVDMIDDDKVVGVCGLKGTLDKTIGKTFNGTTKVLRNDQRGRYHIYGDKAEVYYTSILKSYPFPEYDGEKFLSEAVVWNKIAFDGYKLLYFNEIIYLCDYLNDGLTKNIYNHYRKSPKGFLEYIMQLLYIERYNLFRRMQLVSFYYAVMHPLYTDDEIKNDLHVSKLFLKISVKLRKLLKK